ncbi:hypothetical protein SLA2020_060770 [Shorea laevis]
MTGPAAGVNMMGYANMDQISAGIYFRLRARNFIAAESSRGSRFAFINLDAGMASQLVTIKVLKRLKLRFGDLYTEENLAISGFDSKSLIQSSGDFASIQFNSTYKLQDPVFAAGTTNGHGVFGFQQGDTKINKFWKKVRDLLKEPSQHQVDCQQPKAVLLNTGEMFEPHAWAPAILPIQILRLGKFIILSVPGEFTTMAGPRLREAVKQTLISNGTGEFNDETHVIIAGLTKTYSQYVATFEEYICARSKDTRLHLRSMFSDMDQDVTQPKGGSFKKGDKPSATFWSANPRYDLLTEGTFAVVDMLQGEQWSPVYDDDDFSLKFKWKVDNVTSYGLATLEWEVQKEASPGVYRFRHFGSSKKTKDSPNKYFTGASSAFTTS